MSRINDELDALLAPSGQLHYGPAFDPSPVSSRLALTGQLNPAFANQYAAQNGRYLSGLGAAPQMNEQVIERDEHAEIYDLEAQDDVLGSGVFDPFRRPGTANTNTGVFTSHYSLPGYDARAIPFTVDSDVTDLTDDASIVHVPGGGMAYVEAKGKLVGPACPAPGPPPHPQLRPAPPGGRDQTYVNLTPYPAQGWDVDSLLQQAEGGPPAARVDPPFPEPAGLPRFPHPVPAPVGAPGGGVALPVPTQRAVSGLGSPAFPYEPGAKCDYRFPPGHPPRQPLWNVEQLPTRPRYPDVPGWPPSARVAARSMVSPMGARIAMGQAEAASSSPATWAAFLGAGVVAGIALRIFAGTLKGLG